MRSAPILGLGLALLASCGGRVDAESAPEVLEVEILDRYPHDRTAFTQGLIWDDGALLESTGLYGRSTIRRVEPTTGRILESLPLDPGLFAEGLARTGDRLVQLTWQSGVAFLRDPATLEVLGTWFYDGEGWGLATFGGDLLMSDGTATLTRRSAEDFRVLDRVEVRSGGRPVPELNELEVVEGRLYANVLGRDEILRIDPTTGIVTARIDASGLREDWDPARRGEVLNGLAWDGESWWVTGKFWPWIYRVRFVPVGS